MFFVASKLLAFFILPSNAIAFLILVGFVASLRWRRAGRALLAVGLLLLVLCGLGPVANLLIAPLESRFPQPTNGGADAQGLILLGGGIETGGSGFGGLRDLNEAGDRVVAAAVLLKQHPGWPAVLSGGNAELLRTSGQPSEAEQTGRLLAELGVDPRRLILEGQSRNTTENAVFTAALLGDRPETRWLLVTSAFHMPRAVGAFRAAGIEVIPYPVDFRHVGERGGPLLFGRFSEGLRRTDLAVREWIGLVAYRLAGQTTEWLPGAAPAP